METFQDGYTGLKYANVTTITNNQCKKSFARGLVKDEMVCAYSGRLGIGACLGDSGGPLISDNKLIGIVSFARICALGYPDGYTRISAYADWIDQTMKQESQDDFSQF